MSFGGTFDYTGKRAKLDAVNTELEDPDIWSNQPKMQDLNRQKKQLELIVNQIETLDQDITDSTDLFELARSENDESTILTIAAELDNLKLVLDKLEFHRMFSNPMDPNNCFIDIQSGSGGTEAQDWADMLFRMYLRYCDKKGFSTEILEEQSGEVAGIKNATIKVSGDYAFGYLRTETGVHRLVRNSPFDSNNKRHTSFASVFVYPEIDDNIEISINPADLRTDTYRAQGAGGQHINKTDSAVRITHIPTNTVVQCQSDRSQHRNRDEAMKMLKAKLYEIELRKKENEKQKLEDNKTDIGWGHQIRSYVFDQSRIKDLRTNIEIGNIRSVMDGDLDEFIAASLKQGV
ncbi:MAG: peptide chain release factor 2 [Burkholderiales bacterium]|jgi:peptide chain release factor 2|nr:peptide chain release factor 2 [Burkholderiales bacterium]